MSYVVAADGSVVQSSSFLGGLIVPAVPPTSLQLTRSRLPSWCAALSGAKSRRLSSNVALVGDSTTAGYGALSGSAVAARAASYPAAFCKALANAGVPVTDGGFFSDQNVSVNGTTGPQYDGRLVWDAGWTTTAGSAVCGGAVANSTTTGPIAFTPQAAFDTIVSYQFTTPGGGSAAINVDGGSSLGTVNYNAGGAITQQTIKCPIGTHTLNISRVSGGCFHFGAMTFNSAAPSLRVYQLGHCGAVAASFTAENYSLYNLPALMALIQPSLTIVQLTINDANNGTNQAAYQASMQSIITNAMMYGDVMLVVGVPSALSQISAATQIVFSRICYALALTNNIPLLDIRARWLGGYETLNPSGFYADVLHPCAAGYADIASFVAGSLLSI